MNILIRDATKEELEKINPKEKYRYQKKKAVVIEIKVKNHHEIILDKPYTNIIDLYTKIKEYEKTEIYKFDYPVDYKTAHDRYANEKCTICKNKILGLVSNYCKIRGKKSEKQIQFNYKPTVHSNTWHMNCAKFEQ